ncbi:hypothetical protein BP6252_00605 [Coleophoma cylindrospora]|uniref:DNA (cytosine-5)-methyltransferase 1 replication foci domain-containing protein n=1 Tax=Coleophoma cylindrospora TaxID=1849047 RepID=A0A3D8SQI3_9HELO|nr:hypothetical protein BP6252_00605 [Coleophoma cylindrospora]
MPRRRRSCSDVSGDEIMKTERVRCLTESSVLKPISADIDPNDWPCFLLQDAAVYLKDGRTIANMLQVDLQGPFIVRGRLVVDPEDRNYLINKKFQSQYIEIGNCTSYSIGYDPITLWASGHAGWFELQPSRAYLTTYKRIQEGIGLYFTMTMIYETVTVHSKKSLTLDQVLEKYAENDGTGLVKAEVNAICLEHAEFLIAQMRKRDAEGINWKATAVFKWLKSQFPETLRQSEDAERRAKKSNHTPEPGMVEATKVTVSDPTQPKQESTTRASKPRDALERRRAADSQSKLDIDDVELGDLPVADETTTIGQIALTLNSNYSTRHRLTITSLGTKLYYSYSITHYQDGQNIVKAHASQILALLTEEWRASPLYKQLEATVRENKKAGESLANFVDFELRKRGSRKAETLNKTDSQGTNPADVIHKTSGASSSAMASSSGSPNPPRSVGKTLPATFSGRRSGKGAGLRLASSPSKRLHDDSDGSTSGVEPTHSRKRKRQKPALMIEMGSSEDTDTDEEQATEDDSFLEIVTERLPSLNPTGPNGMWSCQHDGCNFIVRAADEDEGKKEVQEHIFEHADVIERESLVLKEARPHLPVK